jgi:hypothetical protein
MTHFQIHTKSAGRCHSRTVSAKTPVTRAQGAPYRNFRSCEPNSLRHRPWTNGPGLPGNSKNGLGTREFSTKYLGLRRLANSNTQTMQSQGLGLHSLQIQFNTNEQECLKTSQEPKK